MTPPFALPLLDQRHVYVSPGGDDANNGASWSTAVRTIDRAMDLIGVDGAGQVEFAPGTYAVAATLPVGVRAWFAGHAGSES